MSVTKTRQKDLGAFYTPEPMAASLVDWAVRTASDNVLDPSYGGLVFLREADRRLRELGNPNPTPQLFGADLDEEAFEAAKDVSRAGATLIHRDFLRIAPDGRLLPRVTAVVGNPPYIRYQKFKQGRERGSRIAARHGVNLTRLASSWAPLLIHAADFVAPGGRLAQVVPAELIHAQYAQEVLNCLCERFARVVICMFDEHVFQGAQEEIVLLLAEDRGAGVAPGAEVLSFRNLRELQIPDDRQEVCGGEHKLLAGLIDPLALATYDRLVASDLTRSLGDLASVNIGAVTGANDFFVRPASEVEGMPSGLLRPAVSKASHVGGARFRAADLQAMDEQGVPARMLVLDPDLSLLQNSSIAELVAEGERRGVHERYKCRIRAPWWALPSSQVACPPHLFMTYMASDCPRLVANDAGALSTNTVHGVRLHNGTNPRALAASFYNSMTMLSAELVGRSYGGGVLKLEPTEAERLIMPCPSTPQAGLIDQVDELLRQGRHEEAISAVDLAVLINDLGVPEPEVAALRQAAERLRGRRRARAKRKT